MENALHAMVKNQLKLMLQRSNSYSYKTKALVLSVFVFLCLGFVFYVHSQVKMINNPTPQDASHSSLSNKSYVKINNNIYHLVVAKTPEERTKGLSNWKSLKEDEGMFFVFPKEGKYGFWMKDMFFPIDILWLDREGRVIYMVENVKPDSYPKTYYPSMPALFVLELPSSSISKERIKVGDIIEGNVFDHFGQ